MISSRIILAVVVVAVVAVVFASAAPKESKRGPSITCGSTIKLENKGTKHRLHSHEIQYGSGSRQQSVTGFKAADDPNSYWLVRGAHGTVCPNGKTVQNGDVIRLQHVNTRRNLHSHLHASPLSSQQEVSAWGQHGEGDSGDNWEVVVLGGDSVWRRDREVAFRHKDTGLFLFTHNRVFPQPISGQQEVTCNNKDSSAAGNVWVAREGLILRSKK